MYPLTRSPQVPRFRSHAVGLVRVFCGSAGLGSDMSVVIGVVGRSPLGWSARTDFDRVRVHMLYRQHTRALIKRPTRAEMSVLW